ncbi:hypothetical protein D9O50_02015 [Oxalobacteraceae bacterium CAVE-383]|nr:hypothetical protein D9O50_02015 [Oxalobacteraceae bacterium CAVE-383]
MTTINEISTRVSQALSRTAAAQDGDAIETGAAGKASPAVASKTVKATKEMLAVADKAMNASKRMDANKPELAAPAGGIGNIGESGDVIEMLNAVVKRLEDPAIAGEANRALDDLRKNGGAAVAMARESGFDINNMNSFAPVDLIMLLLHLLDTLRANDASLNAKMTIGAAASVERTALSLEKQGYDQMVGAITGAVTGLALSVAGTGLQMKGGMNTYRNEKNIGAATSKVNTEAKSALDALKAAKPGTPGAEASALTGVAAGAPKTAAIAPSDAQLSKTHRETMKANITDEQAAKLAELQTAKAKNALEASKWAAGGQALTGLGTAAGGVATAAAHVDVMKARSDQTHSENTAELQKKLSSAAEERGQAGKSDIQAVLQIIKEIMAAITQGRGGQINNIRA